MSAKRLFQIVNILLERKSITATELSDFLEVSVRTIYRDIDTLSSSGVPIYTTQGKGGGISLLENYVLDKALLSKEEQDHILIALKNISAISNEMVDTLLLKLIALFKSNNTDWMEVDLSRWGSKEYDTKKFNILKEATIKKFILSFRYVNSYGKITERKVKPVKIIFKSKEWYIQGFCLEKNSFRIFKINRMSQILMTKKQFDTPFNGQLNGNVNGQLSGKQDKQLCEVLVAPAIDESLDIMQYPKIILKFNKQIAYRVYDEFDEHSISFDEDANLIVEVHMPEDTWLYGFLLSFGAAVQVLEPLHIRYHLAKKAQEIFLANSQA